MTDVIQQAVLDGGDRLAARFWEKVQAGAPDACWPWTAAKLPSGYGYFSYSRRRSTEAHRVAYTLTHGPIPAGMTIDHVCHTDAVPECNGGVLCPHRACCNPAHLEAVTQAENNRRGEPANRTRCPHGHAYDDENTYTHGGKRFCRRCHREGQRRRRQRMVRPSGRSGRTTSE